MSITVSTRSEGESWTADGARFRVVEDGTAVEGRWGLVEGTLPPGFTGPPQHIHREHDESFFVLVGAVAFTSGTDHVVAEAGTLVVAPIGDPHTFANASADESATMLCTVTPERYIGYFRELATLRPGADGRLDPKTIAAVMARYATEPYSAVTS